jgi:nitrogen regulatory protein PII
MEMEIDLATIKHGKFKSGSEFKGNRIECNSISLYQNKCMLPKGKINIVVSDSFVKKLIEQRITVQKIYRLKFKIISDRIFEIEEMK